MLKIHFVSKMKSKNKININNGFEMAKRTKEKKNMRKVLADYDVKYFFSTFTLFRTLSLLMMMRSERHTNAPSDIQLLTF